MTVTALYDTKNVGTGKTITATIGGAKAANYLFSNGESSISTSGGVIERATLTITRLKSGGSAYVTGLAYTYDASEKAGVRLMASGVFAGDSVTVVVTGGENITISGSETSDYVDYNATNAGTYTYTIASGYASGTDGANYYISTTTTASFVINPKNITITWTVKDSSSSSAGVTGSDPNFGHVYHGKTWTFTPSWTGKGTGNGLANGSASAGTYESSALTYEVTAGALTTSSADVGTYNVTIESTNENYTLMNATATMEVTAKTLSITGTYTKVYDGTTNFTNYSLGSSISFTENTATVVTGVNGESITVTATYNSKDVSSASSVTFVKSNGSGKATNYALTGTGISNSAHTATITPVTLSFAFTNVGTYDSIDTSVVTAGVYVYTYSGTQVGVTMTVTGQVGSESIGVRVQNSGSASWVYPATVAASSTRDTANLSTGGNAQYKAVNCGSYGITVTQIVSGANGGVTSNYQLPAAANRTKSWRIETKALTVSWTEGSFTYNKTEQGHTYTINGLISGETPSVTLKNTGASAWTYPAEVATNGTTSVTAGSYAVKGMNQGNYAAKVQSLADNGSFLLSNYSLTEDSGVSFTINPKTITIAWSAADNSETPNAAGATDATHFTATYNKKLWTMTPALALATEAAGEGTSSDNKAYTGDTISYSYTGTRNGTDAGTYSVTATSGNANYSFSSSAQITISRRTIGLSWAAANPAGGNTLSAVAGTVTYDKKAHGVALTANNICDGDRVTIGVILDSGMTGSDLTITSGTSGSANYTAVNVKYSSGVQFYTASVNAGNIGDNYVIAANTSATFKIQPRALTVTAIGSKVYDHTTAVTGAITYSGIATGDSASDLSASAVYSDEEGAKDVGEDKEVTVTISNRNYSLDNTNGHTAQSATFALGSITPKDITVTWSATDSEDALASGSGVAFTTTYNGRVWTLGYAFTAGATSTSDNRVYDGDTVTVGYAAGNTRTNAGELSVTASATGADIGNYTITNDTATLNIAKKTLSFNTNLAYMTNSTSAGFTFAGYYSNANGPANAMSFVSVGDNVYQGLEITISGIVSGETITLSKTSDGRPIFLSPTSLGNGEHGYAYAENKLISSATSFDISYAYNAVLFAGENHDYNTNSSSLINLALKSGVAANANYTLSSTSFNWNMTTKAINRFTWTLTGDGNSDLSVVYDASAHTMSATPQTRSFAAIKYNDGYAPSAGGPTVASYTGTRSATNVGDYTVNVAAAVRNSAFALQAQASAEAWEITPAVITVTEITGNGYGEGNTRVYDGTTNFKGYTAGTGISFTGNTATITTGIGSETVTLSASYDSEDVGAGITITYGSLGNGSNGGLASNYELDLSGVLGHGAITAKTLEITYTNANAEWTYNAADRSVSVTVGGVISGDSVTIAITKGSTTGDASFTISGGNTSASRSYTASDAATYTVTVSGISGTDSGNYQLPASGTSVSFVINPKSIAISWTASDATGGSDPDFTKRYNGATSTLTPVWMGKGTGNGLDDESASAGTYESDPLDLDIASYTTTSANVGTYSVTVTNANTNYTITNATASMTINKAQLSFVATTSGSSYTYNGQSTWRELGTYQITGIVGAETLVFRNATSSTGVYQTGYAYEINNTTNVPGKYSFAADGSANGAYTHFGAKNVGVYSVYVHEFLSSTGVATNYEWASDSDTEGERTITFTITEKSIAAGDISAKNKVYDGTAVADFAVTGVCAGDDLGLTGTFANEHVGTGKTVTYSFTNANYTVKGHAANASCTDLSANISKKDITVTWSAADNASTPNVASGSGVAFNATYNGKTWTLRYAFTTGAENDSDNKVYTGHVPTISLSSNTIMNAGSVTVSAGMSGDYAGDYNITNDEATLTIAQKALTASWSETDSFTYDGAAHGRTLTISGLVGSETIGFTATGDGSGSFTLGDGATTRTFTGTNAGSYGVSISSTLADGTGAAANYSLTSTSASWTIAKRILTLSWTYKEKVSGVVTSSSAYTFGSNLTFVNATTYLSVVPTITNVVDGESLTLNDQYFFGFCTCEGAEGDHDHNHGVTTTGVNHAGQYWTYFTVSAGANTTISNYTFDGTTGNTGIVGYTLTSGDELRGSTFASNAHAEIDLSDISTSGAFDGLATGTAFLGAFYVNRATIGFTPDASMFGELIYNGSSLTSRNGLDITLSGTTTAAQVDVKVYRSTDGGESWTQIYGNTLATYRTNYKNVAGNDTKNYGLYHVDFEQKNQEGTTTCDTVSGTLTGTRYTYEIKPLPVEISWSNAASLTYNGSAQSGRTPTLDNLVSGDTCSLTVSYYSDETCTVSATNVNAGTYYSKVTALGNPNYCLTDQTIHVVDNEDGVYILDDSSYELLSGYTKYSYDEGEDTYTPAIDGTYIYLGSAYVLISSLTKYSTDTTAVSGLKSGSWTISQATVTASWSLDNSFTYNGAAQGRTLTIEGIIGDETLGFTPSTTGTDAISVSAFTLGNGTKTYSIANAGSYGVSISSTLSNGTGLAANYIFAGTSTAWSIAQKALTASWSETDSFVYDGAAHGRTLTITGIVGDETLGFSATGDGSGSFTLGDGGTHAFTMTDVYLDDGVVRSYGVTGVTLSSNGTGLIANYTLASTSASWTIEQRLHQLCQSVLCLEHRGRLHLDDLLRNGESVLLRIRGRFRLSRIYHRLRRTCRQPDLDIHLDLDGSYEVSLQYRDGWEAPL